VEAATGYALRSFHCAMHPRTKEDNHSGNPYTYPQPVLLQAGLHPGSKLDRRGGSKFIRRGQRYGHPDRVGSCRGTRTAADARRGIQRSTLRRAVAADGARSAPIGRNA